MAKTLLVKVYIIQVHSMYNTMYISPAQIGLDSMLALTAVHWLTRQVTYRPFVFMVVISDSLNLF